MANNNSIERILNELYDCGLQEDGTHSRISFTSEDIRGREIFADYLKQLDMTIEVDPAGNMIGRLSGINDDLPPIMVGSHLDTVPDGGKYDGAYGCVCALEAISELLEEGKKLKHPIEIVVFADEEGVRFGKGLSGSNALSGMELTGFSKDDIDNKGITREEAMGRIGVNVDTMKEAARKREDVCCFLEIHVEQGRALEKNNKQIGVVTTIAGVSRYSITIDGETNHSGSTMMEDRKDALVGAARIISEIPIFVNQHGSKFAVGTVGVIGVDNGALNVVPGKVSFTLEVRDQFDDTRKEIVAAIFDRLDKICEEADLSYNFKLISEYTCAPMDDKVVDIIDSVVKDLGYDYQRMSSGAFHDAMYMTRTFRTGMLFVPSIGGISHSPAEYTKTEDLQAGCEVLKASIIKLDEYYD